MKRSKYILPVSLLIVMIGVVAFFIIRRQGPEPENTASLEPLVVGDTISMQNALLPIADHQKFFEEDKLKVRRSQFPSGKEALDALIAKSTDVSVATDANIVRAISKGEKLVVIAAVDSAYITVVSRKAIASGKDFVGMRVGTTLGTASDQYLSLLLSSDKVPASKVTILNLRPQELVLTFSRDNTSLDAIVTWDPYAKLAQNSAPGSFARSSQGTYKFHFFLVTRPEVLAKKRNSLISLLKTLKRAQEYLKEHQTESQEYLASFQHIDTNIEKELWSGHSYSVNLANDIQDDLKSQFHGSSPDFSTLFASPLLKDAGIAQ